MASCCSCNNGLSKIDDAVVAVVAVFCDAAVVVVVAVLFDVDVPLLGATRGRDGVREDEEGREDGRDGVEEAGGGVACGSPYS